MLEPSGMDATLRCTQCSHRAVWPFQLNHHIQKNHKTATELFSAIAEPELHPCFYCNFSNHCKLNLHEHCVSKHDSTSFEDVKIENVEPHKEIDRFLCVHCGYNGNSTLHFLQHQKQCDTTRKADPTIAVMYSENDSKPSNLIYIVTDNFRCTQCEYKCNTIAEWKEHLLHHEKVEKMGWFKCPKCVFRSKRRGPLITHMQMHVPCNVVYMEKQWFNCMKCAFRTVRKAHLRAHLLKHDMADDVWHDCVKCPFRFKRPTHLKKHVMLHHADEKIVLFACDKCDFSSLSETGLKEHKAIHIDWFCCSMCSYRGKQESFLERHMLTHNTANDTRWAAANDAKCATNSSNIVKEQGCLKTQMRQRMLELLKSTGPVAPK